MFHANNAASALWAEAQGDPHELADALVNFDGYADDSVGADRRSIRRDNFEREFQDAPPSQEAFAELLRQEKRSR